MTRLRVLIADARAPFSEADDGLTGHLVTELLRRGHDAERVSLPVHLGTSRLIDQACAWRMLNLANSNARPVDLVVATGFPAWFARHPRKVAWIAHDEIWGAPDNSSSRTEEEEHLRQQLGDLDSRMLGECRHVFARTERIVQRLRSTGHSATLLSPPHLAAVPPDDARRGDAALAWDAIFEQLIG